MAPRGRVEMRRIEDRVSRQVRFSKRRTGLFKKAAQLAVLCDAEVSIVVFSPAGKVYQYSSTRFVPPPPSPSELPAVSSSTPGPHQIETYLLCPAPSCTTLAPACSGPAGRECAQLLCSALPSNQIAVPSFPPARGWELRAILLCSVGKQETLTQFGLISHRDSY